MKLIVLGVLVFFGACVLIGGVVYDVYKRDNKGLK